MRRTPFRWIAAASLLLASIGLQGARRPAYGGELRIEFRARLRGLDPMDAPSDALAFAAQRQLLPAVFETLVRLDDRGEPQPLLAESWTHDVARKSWIFTPRKNVILQDGTPWTPSAASLVFPDTRPIEQILRELAHPRNSIVVRTPDGNLVGTGPFRIARWEPERTATLAAHERYWGGRPYLDSIQIQMGRSLADQAVDFQAGRADAVEAGLRDLRAPRTRGTTVFVTQPVETLALQFEGQNTPDAVREAVALSIDRSAIYSVLLQRQGEVTGALLPQWLSGYAFVFPTARNVARARQIVPSSTSLTFSYDRQDPLIRAIGERISVNASEAGIALRSPTGPSAALTLTRLPVTSHDAFTVLEDFAALLKSPAPASPGAYETESALIGNFRVIPLFHLPQGWLMQSRVKDWVSKSGLNWADGWLDPGASQ